MCIPLCTTVVHNTARSSSDDIPRLYLQTTTIAQMLSIGGEGGQYCGSFLSLL